MIKAEIFVDPQHGPGVRVECGENAVCVWLLDETAVVTNPQGQYGLEVSGPFHEFRSTLAGYESIEEYGLPPVKNPPPMPQVKPAKPTLAGYQPIKSNGVPVPPGDE